MKVQQCLGGSSPVIRYSPDEKIGSYRYYRVYEQWFVQRLPKINTVN